MSKSLSDMNRCQEVIKIDVDISIWDPKQQWIEKEELKKGKWKDIYAQHMALAGLAALGWLSPKWMV